MNNKHRIDFVVLGSEESCAINDFGYRPLIFAGALSRSEHVGKVLVVNCPVSAPRRVADRLCVKKRVEDHHPVTFKKGGVAVCMLNEKLFMLNLTSLFPGSEDMWLGINSRSHARCISNVLQGMGFDDPVLWITAPRMVDTGALIATGIKIFDAIDDMLVHPEMNGLHAGIRRAYQWADDHVDLISIASEGQRKMFPNSKKLFLLPNGVDDIFLNSERMKTPNDMNDIRKPVIGYVGVLQERMDISLMKEVVNLLPDHSFVFVGPVEDQAHFKPLTGYANVRFLGRKKYSEIPGYIRSFDVCVIPHKINAFTDSMNPLKIYEYLGCGKPVVTTPVAGTEIFRGLIHLAADARAFSDSVRRATSENTPQHEAARREAASRHSLDFRVKAFIEKIHDFQKNGLKIHE